MSKNTFSALLVEDKESQANLIELENVDALPNQGGDLLIRVTHSSLNYKDGLAVTGKGKVLRSFPIVPGIDLAGVVEDAGESTKFKAGDQVFVTGWGVGEQVSGGYAGFAKVKPEWAELIPEGLSAMHCMALGTAGFTAMLATLSLEDHKVLPDSGPVLVTGASGGVGSIAISLLAKRQYNVVASTGRIEEQGEYLKSLGASEIIHREELSSPSGRPLDSERWAGAIDSVGGETLASILRQTQYRGSVAACGLAGGASLPSTVLPFILRGVNLLGIDSVMCPSWLRKRAWSRMSEDIDLKTLEQLIQVIPLDAVPDAAQQILAGKIRGRIVVDMSL
ncbi:zinc-binding alcohol dehydrogenase [Methylophaga aminisulfidivorans MP]|uniref:Zinc-binding alcohol dehydrogenase n=1 Tax=Methylophaga aminisulfidivorans MP TaxID=1026882 RepID=F5T2J3_9GAMM|nr:MDR family oxidoreductase [Methylophaga aminisulfidivorans]EGL53185.1 zinc-binding alcohol dehydrogenase [Methylophaga aminisulfidivorans MP]